MPPKRKVTEEPAGEEMKTAKTAKTVAAKAAKTSSASAGGKKVVIEACKS